MSTVHIELWLRKRMTEARSAMEAGNVGLARHIHAHAQGGLYFWAYQAAESAEHEQTFAQWCVALQGIERQIDAMGPATGRAA